MKELYKKDSKGKLRIWKIYTNGAELIQEAGLLDGKLVKNSKICIGKNIGKSNETSPEEQALSELESEWKDKIDKGYFETLREVESTQVVLPMLAKSYKDEKDKIVWDENVYIQPKLDGMRCLAHISYDRIKLVSRDGKTIEGLDHIRKDLQKIDYDIILDGELYAHGASFQENMRLIKKYRPGETESIKFHIYDSVSDEKFINRLNEASKVVSKLTNCGIILTIPLLDNNKDLALQHGQNLKEGYEGSIIRWGTEGYKVKGRSSNLLKYKDFIDIAIKIKDVEPAPQRPDWGVPVFEWKGAENNELRAGMKFSHEERKEWLINKKDYIGKTAEVRFFEYSDEGVPRFPVCVGIRLDK